MDIDAVIEALRKRNLPECDAAIVVIESLRPKKKAAPADAPADA